MALVFTLPETAPFSEVRRRVAEQLQALPTTDLRFWRWAARSGDVYRPAVPVLGETSLAVRRPLLVAARESGWAGSGRSSTSLCGQQCPGAMLSRLHAC